MGFFDVIAAPLGGIISSVIGSHSAKSVSADNLAAAREAMQNKHQWEVEDLKKAGLNPILSAHGSTGTTSGSGVAFTPENPFSSYAQTRAMLKKNTADINSANAAAANLQADARLKGMEYIKQRSSFFDYLQQQSTNSAIRSAELENVRKQGRLLDSQILRTNADTSAIEASRNRDRAEQPLWEIAGNTAKGIRDAYHQYWEDNNRQAKEYNDWFYKHYGIRPFNEKR